MLFGIVLAAALTTLQPATTPQGRVTAQPPAPARAPTPDTTAILLRAQLDEMRRGNDALLSTVHWSLGVVASIFVGLAAFSWFSSTRVYTNDLKRIRAELDADAQAAITAAENTLTASMGIARDQMRTELLSLQTNSLERAAAELRIEIGYRDASVRYTIKDYSLSLQAATRAAREAQRVDSNLLLPCLDMITNVLHALRDEKVAVAESLLAETRAMILDQCARQRDARSEALLALLNDIAA